MLSDGGIDGPAAMLVIDMDGFMDLVKGLGRAGGDRLLSEVAGRLREHMEAKAYPDAAGSVTARSDADEFFIFIPSLSPEASAMRVAGSLQKVLEPPVMLDGNAIDISASIGIAYYPDHGVSAQALFRAADLAMQHARAQGGRQAQLYGAELEQPAARVLATGAELRRGLTQGEFSLQYQPMVDTAQKSVVAVEALVRWHPPGRDMVSAEHFLPICGEAGLMAELGEWIVDAACEAAARWAARGVTYPIAINISGWEIAHPGFFQRLDEAMRRHGTPPQMLELELTESLAMSLPGETLEALAGLRWRGMAIVMDDFGTGFSNLARLRDLPVSRIKIDRCLVRDIAMSAEARTICSAVAGLIIGLGLEVVAEGVETAEQELLLKAMGCWIFQGYHLSRALPEQDFLMRFAGSAGAVTRRAAND